MKENSFVEELVMFTFPYQTNGNQANGISGVGHVFSKRHWKGAFDFTGTVNSYRLKQETMCQIVRITFLQNYKYTFENIFTAWS